MTPITRFLVVAFAALSAFPSLLQGQVFRYDNLNSVGDDYAIAFRTAEAGTEIWYTVGSMGEQRNSRRLRISSVENGKGSTPFDAAQPLNQIRGPQEARQYLDGTPSFSRCNPNCGVFTSNRADANGRYHDNDIYELAKEGGTWVVRRISENGVNGDSWDDSPSLSPDGMYLYFSSNRRDPFLRESDIYVSRRTGGSWGVPELLPEINSTGAREQTPYASADGYLYYATDASGDFDIWRVRLRPDNGMPIPGTKEPVPFPEVNQPGSHEVHPSFTPGRGWFVFTSSRGGAGDYNLYYCRGGDYSDSLTVKVLLRTRRKIGGMAVDLTEAMPEVKVLAVDLQTRMPITESLSDGGGTRTIRLNSSSSEPADDRLIREVEVRAVNASGQPLSGHLRSAIDTLKFIAGASCSLTHTLFVWDTALLFDDACRQNFQVKRVEFFVKGYWCPTTKRFADLADCRSVFADIPCTTIPSEDQPGQPCESNELYDYEFIPARMDRSPQPGLCIRWSEIKEHGSKWGERVDLAIDTLVENMKAGLLQYCVQRSIGDRRPIEIEVIGWTDPDPLHDHCLYTGPDIVFTEDIRLWDAENKRKWIRNDTLKHNTRFTLSPWNGNQLLSDLRAYNMAVLLDRLWRREIPVYDALRSQGLIKVIARGEAVSKEQRQAKELQRAIDVIISAQADARVHAGIRQRTPGASIVLCGSDCIDRASCY